MSARRRSGVRATRSDANQAVEVDLAQRRGLCPRVGVLHARAIRCQPCGGRCRREIESVVAGIPTTRAYRRDQDAAHAARAVGPRASTRVEIGAWGASGTPSAETATASAPREAPWRHATMLVPTKIGDAPAIGRAAPAAARRRADHTPTPSPDPLPAEIAGMNRDAERFEQRDGRLAPPGRHRKQLRPRRSLVAQRAVVGPQAVEKWCGPRWGGPPRTAEGTGHGVSTATRVPGAAARGPSIVPPRTRQTRRVIRAEHERVSIPTLRSPRLVHGIRKSVRPTLPRDPHLPGAGAASVAPFRSAITRGVESERAFCNSASCSEPAPAFSIQLGDSSEQRLARTRRGARARRGNLVWPQLGLEAAESRRGVADDELDPANLGEFPDVLGRSGLAVPCYARRRRDPGRAGVLNRPAPHTARATGSLGAWGLTASTRYDQRKRPPGRP